MEALKPKYVLSGQCRIGTIGQETPLKDFTDEPLFVGDIVIISTIDEMGICSNNGLTVVCSDEWITTSGIGINHTQKDSEIEYFVMGIKKVDFMNKDSEEWIVKKVKSYKDVVNGEHWTNFRFSYSSI